MVLTILFSFAMAQNADHRVNRHLQKTYKQQDYLRQQAEVMGSKLEQAPLQQYHLQEGETYGVVREAPEEALPDFTQPSRVYPANPLEASRESTYKRKELDRYQKNLQRQYKNQYIRNAEKDGVSVHIDENHVVEGQEAPRLPSASPRGSGNSSH